MRADRSLPPSVVRQVLLAVVVLAGVLTLSTARRSAAASKAQSPGSATAGATAFATIAPNDPLFRLVQGYLQVVNAPEGWSLQTGDRRIVVAVIDDGIAIDHPDLAANIWLNPRPGDGGCRDGLHDGCNLLDGSVSSARCGTSAAVRTAEISPTGWHGTYLAGIIGAVGNNGEGIAGVAWQVSLMAARVADCRGTADTTAVVNAIHYAVDQGARLIAVGLTTGRATGSGCRAANRFLADAVQYARDHGVLVIAGAGDDGKSCVGDPAAAPGALAVGGLRWPDGGRWTSSRAGHGSNWGAEVAVAAPANDVAGPVPRRAGQQPPNDLYAFSSGTAAAAAIVAGEAALLLSQNSLLTPDWLITLIELGARPQPDGDTPGWAGAGVVDLAASLRLVPAGFAGRLMINGEPAPDGTLVEGYVGETRCAQAASVSTFGESTFTLFVPAAAMQPGCGAAGAGVEIRVDGVAVAVVPWGAAAYPLDIDLMGATGSPPSGWRR